MRRGFLKKKSEGLGIPLAKTHNAQSLPPSDWMQVGVTMPGHTMRAVPADEMVKKSNFDLKAITSVGTDLFATLSRSQRLVLHRIKVKGSGYTFHSVALIDSRIVPLLPVTFVGPTLPPDDLFEIRSVEGMGQGVFALKAIPTGALILTEHPSIISPGLIKPNHLPLYPAAFKLLDESAAAELRTLMNCKPPNVYSTQEEGILRTNNLGVEMPVPQAMANLEPFKQHGALLLKGSRFNHSCGPNATNKWHIDTFSISFVAARPIAAGEEITISYIDLMMPREERRAKLRHMYNFDCQCKYCDLPDEQAIARSDATRKQLAKEASPTLLDWFKNPELPDDMVIQASKERMAWAVREGLDVLNDQQLNSIVMCYMALGDEKNLSKWARKAEEALGARDRSCATDYSKWRANPRASPLWGTRKSKK